MRQVPRAIMVVGEITKGSTESGGTHVVVHGKNNNGRMSGGFEYRVREVEVQGPEGPIKTVKFEITKELNGSAEDILAEAESTTPVAGVRKKDAAIVLLQTALKNGPKTMRDLIEIAKGKEISQATLVNAKTSLKVKSKKRTGDGLSVWSLPKS